MNFEVANWLGILSLRQVYRLAKRDSAFAEKKAFLGRLSFFDRVREIVFHSLKNI